MKSELQRLCDGQRSEPFVNGRKQKAPKMKIECVYGGNKEPCSWEGQHHPWRVTLSYRGHKLSVDFFQGMAHEKEPTAADVLSCLISDATSVENTRSFEEWCSDFGCDTDSRKAEKAFKACEAMVPKLRRLLGDDFDLFAKAEH
jgi:hypothetical protein